MPSATDTVYIHRYRHTVISVNSLSLSQGLLDTEKSLKNQPLSQIKETVGISIGTDGQ